MNRGSDGATTTTRGGNRILPEYTAYIGIGSNHDPERQVMRAVDELAGRARIRAISTFYRSPAAGGVAAPWFCNGVVAVSTWIPARWLVTGILKPIERRLGRDRIAPRRAHVPIDLDLLLTSGDPAGRRQVIHPAVTCRAYAAVPLSEVAGDVRLDGIEDGLPEIADRLRDQQMTRLDPLTQKIRRRHMTGLEVAR